MKNIFRIFVINLVLLFLFLTITELFFQLNSKYFFLKKKQFYLPGSNFYISKNDLIKKYGTDLFNIPEHISSEKYYDLKTLSALSNKEKSIAHYPLKYFGLSSFDRINKIFNATATTHLTNNLIYNVDYIFDENGYKKVIYSKTDKKKFNEYILALGCSFTFGEGAPSGLDYPSQLAQKISPSYHIYNLSFHGQGPNDLYKNMIKDQEEFKFINESGGIAIWLFIPDHLDRFFCTNLCEHNKKWILQKPYLRLEEEKIVLDGTLQEHKTLIRKFYYWVSFSETLSFFNFRIPLKYSKDDLALFSETFYEMKMYLSHKKNLKQFYFVNFSNFKEKEDLYKELQKRQINIIDYSNVSFNSISPNMSIPVDRHPSPEFYWVLTELLKKDLQLNKLSL